jgi:tRNA threonylcarbamoyladenosine biosynthesis protein TsaB
MGSVSLFAFRIFLFGITPMSSLGLILDLSHAGFAAVLDEEGARVLSRSARPAGTRHDDVADWTETLLRAAGGSFSHLGWLCVGIGPGSFTGIRIAMAFAQGLALPRGIPLHGFTSFEALHLSFSGLSESAAIRQTGALAAIPANAGRFYVAQDAGDPGALIPGEALSAMADSKVTVIAPEITPALRVAAAGFAEVWSPGEAWDASAIARHARASTRGVDKPLYLQLSAAEEKFGQGNV